MSCYVTKSEFTDAGLGQMEGLILGKRQENHFLTGSPLLQSSMEEGIILWYGGVWGGMG
jgi:hypothetical protein